MDVTAISDLLNASFAIGLITILIFVCIKAIPKLYADWRADRKQEHEETTQVISNNTKALNGVIKSVDILASKVDDLSGRVDRLEKKEG